jgi:tRNA(Leu) C34 or U34 (ribose-2'-O)-methylase TrmL
MAFLWGCTSYHIAGRRKWNSRSSIGLHHYLPIEFHDELLKVTIDTYCNEDCSCGKCKEYDVTRILEFIDKNNFFPVVVELGGTRVEEVPWKSYQDMKILFIFGNEQNGIPKHVINAIRKIGFVVSIPQFGIGKCHNVAMAANIVLWEYYKVASAHPY